MITPPTWIDLESWQAFHAMRAKIKAPLTPYAERLILGELVKLKGAGHDPQACLDQSIMNCWRDVFPPRDKGLVPVKSSYAEFKPAPTISPAERESAEKARRACMAAVKVAR